MNQLIKKYIIEYRDNIKQANSESAKKEIFKTLLVRLFDKDSSASKLINEIDTGAETRIYNIPLEHRIKTGAADTQYRNVIIEFEKDLKVTGAHAREQLTEYLAGNWVSGNDYDYTLIATDCITWKIYYPVYDKLLNVSVITLADIDLQEKDSFILADKNAEEFYYFLDHYLFRTQAQIPTYQSVKQDFGDSSSVFLTSLRILSAYWNKISSDSELKVAFDQWHLFLSIAYGSFKADAELFLIHTYLSAFSKILAYAVISRQRFITDDEMKDILTGEIFNRLNVENFIESDFYHWIAKEQHYNALKPVFRKIAAQLSDYDFTKVNEDILKGVYQELIDIETRHSLGEYYTPDWLADKIVSELPLKKNSMCLDPSCGSGTFLRSLISRMKTDFADITLEEILSQIVGIDIHPLSVQIAKTTILLSVADKLKKLRRPVTIQVYLANTLHIPDDSVGLFQDKFDIDINRKKHQISKELMFSPSLFDQSVIFCQELAKITEKEKDFSVKQFSEMALKKFGKNISSDVLASLFTIYHALKEAIVAKQDSIWAFILQNSYRPMFLKEQFDFVVGNPPWLPYRAMNNAAYQDQLFTLAGLYSLVPKFASITHLELAAIFLSHCSFSFLKSKGEIAFVLPRGFLSADHHENTRNGTAQGFRINAIWDLQEVKPLFRITSCVLFATKSIQKANVDKDSLIYKDDSIKGYVVKGNLPAHQINWKVAEEKLSFENVNWFYSVLGKRSSFSTSRTSFIPGESHYLSLFKQGATIVPRNFYFVELMQDIPDDFKDRILYVQTDQEVKKEAKQPWKSIELKMKVNSQFLFRSAIAKNILPFAVVLPQLVHLPIQINENQTPVLLKWDSMLNNNFLESSKWFKAVEQNWDEHKTEKSKLITYLEWLNYQNKITDQHFYHQYLVLYTASSKDANATIIDRNKFDLPFIVESATYWYSTNDLQEAFYLLSYINSNFANEAIKAFQAEGLFGARHVHKKILELPLPKFDKNIGSHKKLAELGKRCTDKTEKYTAALITSEATGVRLGKARLNIRAMLNEELKNIDIILKEVIGG